MSEELFTDVTIGEKYRVDLLVETKLKGEDGLIIVHMENQSYVQPSFSEHMFLYFSRLFEKYRIRIVPIAVFSYDALRDEPSVFSIEFPFGEVLQFRFFPVELRKKHWRDYIRHDNPIAAALLSKMGYTESEKVELKKRVFSACWCDWSWMKRGSGCSWAFFETYVKLSEEEEQQLQREVKAMETKEKEKVLELIISYEQKGREEGLEEGIERGIQQGMKQLIRNMARKGMTVEDIARLVDLSEEEVRSLLKD